MVGFWLAGFLFFSTFVSSYTEAALVCGASRLFTRPGGQPMQIKAGRSRLTHFWSANAQVPRFVYEQEKSGFAQYNGDDLYILEAGADNIISTADDTEVILNSALLNVYSKPEIKDFEVFDRFLVLSVKDARESLPSNQKEPNRVLLIELSPGGTVASEAVAAE